MWSRRGMTDLQKNSCWTGEGWVGGKSNVMSIERLLINMANNMAFSPAPAPNRIALETYLTIFGYFCQ